MRLKFWQQLARNAEGLGGGAGDPPPADPGTPPPADPAAPPPADPGAPPPAMDGKWWQDKRFSEDQRKHLTASGLTIDDPIEAAQRLTDMHRHAMQRLGKDPASILDKPAKDQPVTEWMKANREVFGLPEAPEGYAIEKPKDWPKDAAWDADFEAKARAFAFEAGLPPAAVQGMVGLYAAKVMEMNGAAEADLAAANDRMRGELVKEWGPQADARMLRASQAAQAVAAKAGMTPDQIADVAKSLSAKAGDANVIRMFDALAEAIGDDKFLGGGPGGGASQFGTTPAEARQQLVTLQSPGGAWYEAVYTGNSAKVAELRPQIERLTKIASGQ